MELLFGFRGDPRGTLDVNLGRLPVDSELRISCRSKEETL